MTLTSYQWHQRFLQQAEWTRRLREYVYAKTAIKSSTRLLDIGCGTGVLEDELKSRYAVTPYSLDINQNHLKFAQGFAPGAYYTCGNCFHLPYSHHTFDACLCHFVLLWLSDPEAALIEMTRVTRLNGYIAALAEPDYGGRIDYPLELSSIGTWQTESLKKQGANPNIGRQLRSLFHQVGLVDIEVGVLGGQWLDRSSGEDESLEWRMVEADLAQNVDFMRQSKELQSIDLQARNTGQRILYVPTFYAWGKIPAKST